MEPVPLSNRPVVGLELTPLDQANLDLLELQIRGLTGVSVPGTVLIRAALAMAAARVREFQGCLQTVQAVDRARK